MAREKIDISIRLQRQEKKILELTDQLNAAKDEYEKLLIDRKKLKRRSYSKLMRKVEGALTR